MIKNFFIPRTNYGRKGSALLVVLLAMVVVSLLGMTLLTVTASNFKMTGKERDNQAVYYIAEAGINDTVHKVSVQVNDLSGQVLTHKEFFDNLNAYIIKDINGTELSDFASQFGKTPKAQITVTFGEENIVREDTSKYTQWTIRYELNSKGIIGNQNSAVSSSIDISHRVDKGSGRQPAFNYLLYQGSNQNLTIPNAATVNGDVYGYNVIGDSSSSTVNGSILSLTDVDLAHGTTINGNVYANGMFNTNGDVLLRPSNGTVSGNINAKGSVTVSAGCTVKGSVFAGDNVSLLNTQSSAQGIQGDVNAGRNITRQSYPNTSTYIGGSSYAGGSINQHINADKNTNTNMGIPPRVAPSFLPQQPVPPPSLTNFTPNMDKSINVPQSSNNYVIEPGIYGDLYVGGASTIVLKSGNYVFNSIDGARWGQTIRLDLSSGVPINVYSVGDINYSANVQVLVNGTTWTSIDKLDNQTAKTLAGNVYWETHGNFHLSNEGGVQWFGAILSKGSITAESGATMIGAFATINGLLNIKTSNAIVTYARPENSEAGVSSGSNANGNEAGPNSIASVRRVNVSIPIRRK